MTTLSTDFDSILNKYNLAKINTYKVLELLGTDYTFNAYGSDDYNEHYQTLLNCGTMLTFAKETVTDRNIYHLTSANFCRQRVCPMCQFRKSEKAFSEALKVTSELEDEGYRFLHLVLTIPNVSGGIALCDGIKKLYSSFNKFYNYKCVKKAFKGCLRCLEVSFNYDNDTFHPHLHCLIAVNGSYFNDSKIYLSYDKLRELWTKAVKADQLLQISVRAIKKGDTAGVAEVCKYCVKPLELEDTNDNNKNQQNVRVLLTLWHTLKGVRFVQKYGILKTKFKDIKEDYLDNNFSRKENEFQSVSLFWDVKSRSYVQYN